MTEDDEQSQKATKVVDNAMRTDMLGPKLCVVLRDHKPANDLVQNIIAESVKSNPDVRANLATFIDSNESVKRNKWIERGVAFVAGAIILALINYGISKIG